MQRYFSAWIAPLLLALAGVSSAWAQQVPATLVSYPTMIVHNGKIVSMSDDALSLPGQTGPVVQAMAIRDGRILRMGTDQEILGLRGPQTQVIDLQGQTVVPGLIEKHNHISTSALSYHNEGLELPFFSTSVGGKTVEEILGNVRKKIEELKKELAPGRFIWMGVPGRLGAAAIAREVLNREMLDKLSPNHPVFIAAPISSFIFNSAGRKVLDEYAPKYRGQPDSEVVGGRMFQMMLAGALMQKDVPVLKEALRRELIHYASVGVTTTCSREHTPEAYNALHALFEEKKMEGRYAIVHHAEISGQRDFYRFYGDHSGMGDDYFWEAGVGLEGFDTFTDDALCTDVPPIDPLVREMFARVKPCRGAKGDFERDQVQGMLDSGLRVLQTHGTADKTIDYFFEAVEEAMKKTGMTIEQVRAKQHALDHLAMVRPDQVAKFKHYGIIASPDGTYKSRGVDLKNWYGEKYMAWFQPMRSFIENGVYVTYAADGHLSRTGETPWKNIHFVITRNFEGTVVAPNEALDRVSALKAQTIWSARYVGKKDIGSLQEGYLADFVVLNKDYFTVPEDEIATILPTMTVVGGKIVYQEE
jgi:predicted amidohydrolase YtcJ